MEQSSADEINNEPVKSKASHDPGWNDPPIFSYDTINATVQTKAQKKTLLNKRVAFPMSSQSSSTSPTTSSSDALPSVPPSNMVPPASIPNLPPSAVQVSETTTHIAENTGQNLQKEAALQKVLKDFEEILVLASDDLKKNALEIRRRLDVMKKMWEEDKLKPEIHIKMVQLSEALTFGNADLADNIHMGLMVDHVSLCSPWMVGVRQLIHYVKIQATKAEKLQKSLEGIPTYRQLINL